MSNPRPFTDLEIWLIGTPQQVGDAIAALASIGRITNAGKPQRLYGTDTGRVRRYIRMTVRTGQQYRKEVA